MDMKGQGAVMMAVLVLVFGVIGAVIVDEVAKNSTSADTVTGETHNISSVPETYTLDNVEDGIVPDSISISNDTTETLTEGTNYTLDDDTGVVNITDYDITEYGDTLYNDYQYYPTEYINSSLARTIIAFIVPIILLGLLGVAAFTAYR